MSFSILKEHRYLTHYFPFLYSLDIYEGCDYGCSFCPSSRQERLLFDREEYLGWLQDDLALLKRPRIIGIGGGLYEPFGTLNCRERLTEEILSLLDREGHRTFIVTRSRDVLSLAKQSFQHSPIVLVSFSGSHENGGREDSGILKEEMFKTIASTLRGESVRAAIGAFYSPILRGVNDDLVNLRHFIEGLKQEGIASFLFNFDLNSAGGDEKERVYREGMSRDLIQICRESRIYPYFPIELFEEYLSIREKVALHLIYLWHLAYYMGESREHYRALAYRLQKMEDQAFTDSLKEGKLLLIPGLGTHTQEWIQELVDQKSNSYLKNREENFFTLAPL